MPNLRDIRRRIRSVQNTQQITKAMKMVAAAKLRRSQEGMFAARPYAAKMLEVLNSLASRADQTHHPLLEERPEQKVRVLLVTADRGLCGAFNTNLIRFTQHRLQEMEVSAEIQAIDCLGRKGRDYFRRRQWSIGDQWVGKMGRIQYEDSVAIAERLIESFSSKNCDAVYVVYNQFKSVISQKVVMERLLPIERLETKPEEVLLDYLYEPTP